MRRIEYGSKFKRDNKRMMKRGAFSERLDSTLTLLMRDMALPAKNRPHMLSGEFKGFLECHRTGTHSDLYE